MATVVALPPHLYVPKTSQGTSGHSIFKTSFQDSDSGSHSDETQQDPLSSPRIASGGHLWLDIAWPILVPLPACCHFASLWTRETEAPAALGRKCGEGTSGYWHRRDELMEKEPSAEGRAVQWWPAGLAPKKGSG